MSSATSNPLRIGRIGTDRIDVFIRPVHGETELLALVDRLEELLDAGFETVNVLFESAPDELSIARDVVPDLRGAGLPDGDMGTLTDANPPHPVRL